MMVLHRHTRMNIFVLHTDPAEAAKLHCDQHIVKQILESAQMLCTALDTCMSAKGLISDVPYRVTHKHHRCTLWAGASRSNFRWLCDLGEALALEHLERYNPKRTHASLQVIERCREFSDWVPEGQLTPFAQAMDDKYRRDDAVEAYRLYYAHEKNYFESKGPATWRTPRSRPEWMNV